MRRDFGQFGLEPVEDGARDGDLVESWLRLKGSEHTQRAYAAEADRFLSFVAKPLCRVTLFDLVAFAEDLKQGPRKAATQNRAIAAVKSLLSFAQATGYLPLNVGAALRLLPNRDNLTQRILEEDEVLRTIRAAGSFAGKETAARRARSVRDRLLLDLLYASGVRVSEVCGLKWQDADARHDAGQITVNGKGGKTRAILLDPEAWRDLVSLRGAAGDGDPIFRSQKGGSLDVSQVRRIVAQAARQAGLTQKVSPHWMRHAHASHALDHNAPLHLLQATLGHSSIATTSRYLHARPSDGTSRYLPSRKHAAAAGDAVNEEL